MPDGPVPAPREQGWSRIVLALAAFLLLPHAPGLPSFLPVVDTLLLLLPALAACFVAGWMAGGSLALAVVWAGLAGWLVALPTPPGTSAAYYDLARGWGLLVAGAFGVVCLVGRRRPFIHRVLSAVGIAALVVLLLAGLGGVSLGRSERVFAGEFATRNAADAVEMQESARLLAQYAPSLADLANRATAQRVAMQDVMTRAATPLVPSLLALEALVACALAWALYHRLSRARIGAPLAPVSQFAFSDQLVWALVAGITMLLLPSLTALQSVGQNLLLFFGTLYAIRGYGIVASFLTRRAAAVSVIVAVAIFPLSLVTLPAAVGLGLSDTWFDWRRRGASSTAPRGGG